MKKDYPCLLSKAFVFCFLYSSLFLSCKKEEQKRMIYQELVWSDEFDGNSLDTEKWSYLTGNGCQISANLCGWGNGEEQYYTNRTENVRTENGRLIITAQHDPNYLGSGSNYTSGRILTRHKASWKYGRMEARIKVPSAEGVWPAFWMLPETGSWPHAGEIDIMEMSDTNPVRWNGTLHYYCTPCGGHRHSGVVYTNPVDFSLDFHEYAIEWEPKEIRWYVDGIYRGKQTPTMTHGNAWPFDDDRNFHILLNVAVGGHFTQQNPVSSSYPVSMEVDYVRVYKR